MKATKSTRTTGGRQSETGADMVEEMGTGRSDAMNMAQDYTDREDEGAEVIGGDTDTDGPGPYIMAADTLEGDSVTNNEGESLGEIKSIMVDVPRGRVAYAVLSFGGVLGLGEKLFAIPWSALTLDTNNKCFILDVDKQTLKNASGFDKSHWPSMADLSWARDLHSHYGRRPYWEA